MKHMDRLSVAVCLVALISIITVSACKKEEVAQSTPEPLKPRSALDYSNEEVDALVSMTQESIFSPAPQENGAPPSRCDTIQFLRFKLKNSSDTTEDKDACLLMVPGVLEGANGFEYIARHLVYQAKVNQGLNLEVWAMDRRPNCLEDIDLEPDLERIYHEGVYDGQNYPTPQERHDKIVDLAVGYIYGGAPLENGSRFGGFLKNKDVPFLSEFGLKLNTEDMFKVIQTMVPDPETRRRKVFVGGHSLGGIHTSMFAGWDLDGDPETIDDAGYMNCAGIFCFESSVYSAKEVIEPFMKLMPSCLVKATENMTESAYLALIDQIRSGAFPRLLPIPFLDAEVMAITEVIGGLAEWYPDDEFEAIHQIPMDANLRATIQVMHSRTLGQFLSYSPELRDFRYTYEALLGLFFDDNFSPVSIIQASLGFLTGGPVVEKAFPHIDPIKNTPILTDLVGMILPADLYIPPDESAVDANGDGPLYRWADFDEIGNEADPDFSSTDGQLHYTSKYLEVSDIKDFARALHIGPSNLVEWYFPTRPIVDIMAATLSYGPKYGLHFIHSDKTSILPKIEFNGEEGVVAMDILQGLLPGESTLIQGVNHMDPMFMSANTSGHRENQVIPPLIDFVKRFSK